MPTPTFTDADLRSTAAATLAVNVEQNGANNFICTFSFDQGSVMARTTIAFNEIVPYSEDSSPRQVKIDSIDKALVRLEAYVTLLKVERARLKQGEPRTVALPQVPQN